MDVLTGVRVPVPGTGRGGMVAWRGDRLGACIFCPGSHDGVDARPASAHGQRAAWARGAKPAGAAGVPGAALRSADAAFDRAFTRSLWRDFGSVLSAEVAETHQAALG